MTWRKAGVVLALSALLLAASYRLVLAPSSLLVDGSRPSLDHARPPGDPPTLGNDLTRLFLPHHLGIARRLARVGRLPLWDDRGFGGRPMVGNPQAGLFYPPTWLAWWSNAPATLGWITLGHLLWAGLGTYRLCRTLKMGEWGSLTASGCVQLSPYVLAQVFEGHYPHVWAACWFPWAFEAMLRLRRGDARSGLFLAPILAATFLTGHPQEGYYLVLTLGAWAVLDGLRALRGRDFRGAWRIGWVGCGILALTVGLLGVELIPDAMAQAWGLKEARLTVRLAGRYHLYPVNLLQLLGPRAIGGPGDYFGHENYWESVLSFGLIPLTLAMVGVACSRDRRGVRGWLLLVVAALVFASGRKLGLFAALFQVVPGMDRFRVPARALFLASLGASILAGMGVDALLDSARLAEGWGRLARRGVVVASIVGGLVIFGGWGVGSKPGLGPSSEGERWAWGCARLAGDPIFWLTIGACPVGFILAWKRPSTRSHVAVGLGLLALIELAGQGAALLRTTPADRFLGPDPISRALLQARAPGREPTRIRVADRLYDDLRAGLHGFSKTNVNDSFQLQHAADLYEPLYALFAPDRPGLAENSAKIQAILDRLGVTFLVDDRLAPSSPWPLVASGIWHESPYAVYRNPSELPRAYVVPRAQLAADDASTVARFASVDPRSEVLMAIDPLPDASTPRQPFTPADWASDDPDRIIVRVTTQAPGLLVVAETWMPGWSAEVDGLPAPILRGNRSQQVIPLPRPGSHEVILSYRSPGLAIGLALTAGSALAWASLAWFFRNPRNS